MTSFSLAHLTALSLPPPELIRAAADAGYQSVGLRLLQVAPGTPFHPLMTNPQLLRESRSALAETGITVHDIEFVRITPDIDIDVLEPFLAVGAELGAKWVVAAPYDPDPVRLADRFAALCDRAARHHLGAALEYFPWTEVRSAAAANAIAEATGRSNAAILIDTLHFDRCGNVPTDLDAIPAARLPFIHVCDAPAERPTTQEGWLHHARAERLPPGEGGIAIKTVVDHMPPGIPIALEVPMNTFTKVAGPDAVIRRVIGAARAVLGGKQASAASTADCPGATSPSSAN